MLIKKGFILTLLSFACLASFSQIRTLTDHYFVSPVDYNYRLSGNFCELRESHFHTGIDIKPSNNGGQDKIFSIGDGFISRIKVSAGGYGNAIYVDHPEVGYTSVYAHLDKFNEIVEYTVKQYQTLQESYEIDFYPEPHLFPIKKKEYLGDMGNTGYSFGKHLHFEIRDTKTEKPINPFLFGMNVQDAISPSILSLAVHGLDKDFKKTFENRIAVGDAINQIIEISEDRKSVV